MGVRVSPESPEALYEQVAHLDDRKTQALKPILARIRQPWESSDIQPCSSGRDIIADGQQAPFAFAPADLKSFLPSHVLMTPRHTSLKNVNPLMANWAASGLSRWFRHLSPLSLS